MRWMRCVAAVGAGLLAATAAPQAKALEFPATYSGLRTVSYTTVNTGQLPSTICTVDAPLAITLVGDGTLSYEYESVSVSVDQKTGQCSIRKTGQTFSVAGTHDLQGSFSVTFGQASGFTLNGQYDDAHITANWRPLPYPTEIFDLPFMGHRITVEPDPAKGFEFHKSVLEKKGFKLVIHDPHGRDHLDFATLQILVGGIDTTAHVMAKLSSGAVPYRDESPDSRTKVFTVLPDPQKLMQGHDIFAIPFNGDWRLEFRICDMAQNCFKSVYTVYFGPFVTVWKAWDKRCDTTASPFLQMHIVTIGNIGIDSPKTALYVGLASPDLLDTWTYYIDDFGGGLGGFAWWQGHILPFLPDVNLPSGYLEKLDLFELPDWISIPSGSGDPFSRRTPFPAGNFKFIAAALDLATGAYRRDEQDVKMCD